MLSNSSLLMRPHKPHAQPMARVWTDFLDRQVYDSRTGAACKTTAICCQEERAAAGTKWLAADRDEGRQQHLSEGRRRLSFPPQASNQDATGISDRGGK